MHVSHNYSWLTLSIAKKDDKKKDKKSEKGTPKKDKGSDKKSSKSKSRKGDSPAGNLNILRHDVL